MQEQNLEQDVRQYYDRNTRRFLGLSRISAPKAIHQPLYATKNMSLEDALHAQHRELLNLLPDTTSLYALLDLGCGVGESMLYLARRTAPNFRYFGITLSGNQALRASGSIMKSGQDKRITVFEGSFHALPESIPSIDLAYAIESFIHSGQVSAFFSQVASVLKPGGRLVIFDDFLCGTSVKHDHEILHDLKTGWRANALMTTEAVVSIANNYDLSVECTHDLSPSLRLNRLRDRLIHLLVPVARPLISRSEYCRFLVGGDARQRAYQAGILAYFKLIFVKR